MRRTLAALALVLAPGLARAEDPPAAAPEPAASGELTDEELLELAQRETIEVYAERPDKPYDRDTEIRLTGEQLARRGAVDLATALALLPDVNVREGGRGGFNIDIRGGRRGAVSVFIDGVLVSDPFYGTFDVSSIPITDIVQIRVSTTPQSPIDGPGGPGGVIEVHTRDAIGPQVVVARVTGDSLPSFGVSGTARAALAKHLALRVAASGLAGARDLELPMSFRVGESRRAATGAARLEYRKGDRRVALDAFLDGRHYLVPPSAEGSVVSILMIDRETTTRTSVRADDKVGTLQLQAQAWGQTLARTSRNFNDPAVTSQFASEELSATRTGGMLLATRPINQDFRWVTSATFSRESARVVTGGGDVSEGDLTVTELAGDLQYERGRLRVDLAGGVAIPLGVGADPWPEGKLVARYRPRADLELTATAGYKGRLPTLRERFDAATGNPRLGPELARHAEVRAIFEGLPSAALGTPDAPVPRVRVEVAPYTRKTVGSSRVCVTAEDCPDDEVGRLAPLDDALFYGIDLQGRVKLVRALEVGGAYNYVKACELGSPRGCDVSVLDMGGADPLDRLPRHRAEGWAQVIPHAKLSGVVRLRYFGEAIDRRMTTPGYALLEANLTANLTREYLAVLRVDDALDRRPETRSGVRGPGRVISFVFQGTWE